MLRNKSIIDSNPSPSRNIKLTIRIARVVNLGLERPPQIPAVDPNSEVQTVQTTKHVNEKPFAYFPSNHLLQIVRFRS